MLTGESRPYNPAEARFDAPKMAYNFNPSAGTWALRDRRALLRPRPELPRLRRRQGHSGFAGRLLRRDPRRRAEDLDLRLNWYLNPAIRLMFDYLHVDVDRFNSPAPGRPDLQRLACAAS